jgi:hypothetical protein
MSAQQVFSVAEQAYFQVCFSKVAVPLEAAALEEEPLEAAGVEAAELPLPQPASNVAVMDRAIASARNFFIVFPP